MTSNRSTLAAAAKGFFRILVVCIPVLMFLSVAQGQHHEEPSADAKGMPGALGTMEYKPTDWKGNVTTYWKDTDGVDPGVAGCHIGVTQDGKPNGRFFGEACQNAGTLIESNPGAGVIHPHTNDLGHPDKAVSGPAPCTASARCECN
jgi:hypothetical protein